MAMPIRYRPLWMLLLPLLAGSYCGAQQATVGSTRNVLSVVQFQFTENGPGLGAGYEYMLSPSMQLAVYIPLSVTINVANSNRVYDYNTGNFKTGKANPMYYAMPGIKWYLTSPARPVRYACGLSLVAATGERSIPYLNYRGLNTTELVVPHALLGIIVHHSLSIFQAGRICMGIELGAGSTVVNMENNKSRSRELLVEGNIKIGYRF